MLNSELFDLNNISKLKHINIKLKSDAVSVNKLFANLYDYATDPYFHKIMNIIEAEHMKHYNNFIKNYGFTKIHTQDKTRNRNRTKNNTKKLKLPTRKVITYKNKPNDTLYMLTNLKMILYDYSI
jgi:hypothetical protein